jgi:hypothetical protein
MMDEGSLALPATNHPAHGRVRLAPLHRTPVLLLKNSKYAVFINNNQIGAGGRTRTDSNVSFGVK